MNPQGTELLAQQRALLQLLFARSGAADVGDGDLSGVLLDDRSPQAARGLAAYRANGHALAERTLLAAYPVVAALMGIDNFSLMARDLWHRHPPQRGDLTQWGGALPGFVQVNAQLADTPYLSDVARAEWALHLAAGAPDLAPDLPSFARLEQEDPEGLTLTLAPGTSVISSAYPVASLIGAHLHAQPSLTQAAQRLSQDHGEHALVWRQGLRPRLTNTSPAAAALVHNLLAACDLPQALDAACSVAGAVDTFNFSAWLNAAVTDGLVIGVHRLTPSTEQSLQDPSP